MVRQQARQPGYWQAGRGLARELTINQTSWGGVLKSVRCQCAGRLWRLGEWLKVGKSSRVSWSLWMGSPGGVGLKIVPMGTVTLNMFLAELFYCVLHMLKSICQLFIWHHTSLSQDVWWPFSTELLWELAQKWVPNCNPVLHISTFKDLAISQQKQHQLFASLKPEILH